MPVAAALDNKVDSVSEGLSKPEERPKPSHDQLMCTRDVPMHWEGVAGKSTNLLRALSNLEMPEL